MSPDFNPIEHFWDQIGKNFLDVKSDLVTSPSQLRQAVLDKWQNIPQARIRHLVSSILQMLRGLCGRRWWTYALLASNFKRYLDLVVWLRHRDLADFGQLLRLKLCLSMMSIDVSL